MVESESEDEEDEDDAGNLSYSPAVSSGHIDESQPSQTEKFDSTLRPRRGVGASDAKTTARDDDAFVQSREKTLDSDRAVQERIMESLLSLTQELKSSAHTFHGSLEDEKGVVNRAVAGLDRNVDGMDAAGQRMGRLRKMTEGKGWWARLQLYAWIAGLWVVAFLVVFVMPKLRF
jgi:hypothetical protein